jgi:hypothetical protein
LEEANMEGKEKNKLEIETKLTKRVKRKQGYIKGKQ